MKFTLVPCSIVFLLLLNAIPVDGKSPSAAPASTPAAVEKSSAAEIFTAGHPLSLGKIHADQGAAISITSQAGVPTIKVDLPISSGYPGITLPAVGNGWNFSGYEGLQADLANPGTEMVAITMRVDNADKKGKQNPWSAQVVKIPPGKTATIKVVFGEYFGSPGFVLDTAHVVAIRFFATPPKAPFTVLVSNIKAFKAGAEADADAAAPAPAGTPEPAAKEKPVFTFSTTPPVDITGKHDFPAGQEINDDAAGQLKGLCSLGEFKAFPEADRHVYSFEVWPGDKDNLEKPSCTFNFHFGKDGTETQKVGFFLPGGDPSHSLTRVKDPVSSRNMLEGFGNLDWGKNSDQAFYFDKPVAAFGIVLRSSGDMSLRRFFWPAAKELNGYPVSYTLTDGTIVHLGEREVQGALLKGDADVFVGVIDRSGLGITSVSYMVKGLAGNKSQSLGIVDLAFVNVSKPAVARVINLRSSCDFQSPETIAPTPKPALEGLASLDAFRFIVGNHRYVYRFDTWPQDTPAFDSDTGEFSFDLRGKGTVGEKVTLSVKNAGKNTNPTRTLLKNEEGLPYPVLGGLGDIGKGAWAEQTFKLEKPVWAFGVTYRSPGDVNLVKTVEGKKIFPVSYTLSDGTVVNLSSHGGTGGVISASGKTFVGVIDETGKGISSVTLRVAGTAKGPQPLFIEDLAFAIAGPPPGDWKITLDDNFDGDKLDPKNWTPGYTFPDVINNEMQAFVPENVTVANGVCTIKVEQREARNTDRTGRQAGPVQKFASGAFTSYDKFTQTYGYFEARLKMPKARGAGIWPAFWVLPDRGRDYGRSRGSYMTKDYGRGMEIDIFEFMPRWKRLDGLFPIHMGCIWSYGKVTEEDPAPHGYGSYALDNNGWGPKELNFPELDAKFHTYGLYWSPERLIFYVDSKPVFRVKDPKHIPDVPHYFLFNISISGNGWGKSPDKKHPTMQQIMQDMPNQMEIDYFRAYSGTLDEPVPPAPSDIPPAVLHQYPTPPPAATSPTATPAQAPTATPSASPAPAGVPSAPVNQSIVSPSNG